jgi:site-specific DNA-cytosine methylase
MRVLVACEESQAVTARLRERGHEAYSCDILPCSGGHPEWHLQQDVVPLLAQDWDAVIAFPPCTDLAVSGARHFERKRADGSQQRSIDFFLKFTQLEVPITVIENPIGIMSSLYRKPDQIIQPWMFGHPETKATCLWLKGVSPLQPTNDVKQEMDSLPPNQKHRIHHMPPGPNRARLRSQTYSGIAQAMVDQWF